MLILGIDPGYARAGWGVVSQIKNKLAPIAFGCLETKSQMPHAERLQKLQTELKKIIIKYQPDALAIEELFFFKNLKTALQVAESRGVILAAAFDCHLPIYEFTPLQVKQAITSYGRADKNQIQQMVKLILGMKNIIQPDDAADAVAIAITCAHSLGKKY
ncbi:MAG TPA: crossover junction endodeoxyribonuclease RuvC [Patescibacteria group bacterium]|nr:crossover junction endodeoxyribonuclease RuvC [Patescibacteria group bacterium]